MAASKRKRPSDDSSSTVAAIPPLKRRSSARISTNAAIVNPSVNHDLLDAPNATRASPDGEIDTSITPGPVKAATNSKARIKLGKASKSNGPNRPRKLSEQDAQTASKSSPTRETTTALDPEADDLEEADPEEINEALSRPPPVHSDYLPLPWKGRLGYACLNTYLRQSNPPVFSSRTCRIQSILEHRHPLEDPTLPEHSTKNRPDTSKPADEALGKQYLETVCLANVRDIPKMLRWNDRYGIKFMRLSSEMFPFASHAEYGYKLAPFATEALAEAGKVVAELGHRVTTHPGQFTQLGSPRPSVIENAFRDLEYHDEMLSLLRLPDQQNRDAVMILHMGGMFEGKQETLQRFRENYAKLSQSIKNRLVLENDDVGWNVHDLLPVCEELNIPMVLDYHHHNICFDATQLREGTKDIIDLYPRIKATWDRKGITQKMHYSEPTAPAITPRQRRKHSARVVTLPPCANTMDLMIEAKDKEQAVFELMRTFKLPGYDTFNDIIPYVRNDDNKVALAAMNRKKSSKNDDGGTSSVLVPDDEVGMGGPEGRVYWPPGMEEWLRPKKREVAPKKLPGDTPKKKTKAQKEAEEIYLAGLSAKSGDLGPTIKQENERDAAEDSDPHVTPATKKAKAAMKKKEAQKAAAKAAKQPDTKVAPSTKTTKSPKATRTRKKAVTHETSILTPSASDDGSEGILDLGDDDEWDNNDLGATLSVKAAGPRKSTARSAKSKAIKYAEDEEDAE